MCLMICFYFLLLGFWFSSTDGGFDLVLFNLKYIFVVGRCYGRLSGLLFGLFFALKKLMLLHSNVFGMELVTFMVLFFFSLACRT